MTRPALLMRGGIFSGPIDGLAPAIYAPAAADDEPWTTAPSLGDAATYVALAGRTVSADGAVCGGDVGGRTSIVGTISHTSGSDHTGLGVLFTLGYATTAIDAIDGYAATGSLAAALGGQTVGPGVWDVGSGAAVAEGTTLTLDAGGRDDVVWIFRTSGTLSIAGSVVITGGATTGQADRVWWRLSGAVTLVDDAVSIGTYISDGGACTMNATATPLIGRLIATGGTRDVTILGGSEVYLS